MHQLIAKINPPLKLNSFSYSVIEKRVIKIMAISESGRKKIMSLVYFFANPVINPINPGIIKPPKFSNITRRNMDSE